MIKRETVFVPSPFINEGIAMHEWSLRICWGTLERSSWSRVELDLDRFSVELGIGCVEPAYGF